MLTTATIDLNCKNVGTAVTVTAGPSSVTGDYQTRALANRDFRLHYQVYINPSRTIVWGDGTRDTQPVIVPGPAESRSFTVYGGIFQNQSGEVGRYSDSLVITVVP